LQQWNAMIARLSGLRKNSPTVHRRADKTCTHYRHENVMCRIMLKPTNPPPTPPGNKSPGYTCKVGFSGLRMNSTAVYRRADE
jgi:hypothetical protein